MKSNTKLAYIYTLSDTNGNIRYVGKSINPFKRIYGHISESRIRRSHKGSWIKIMLENNLRPIIEVVDTVPLLEWKYWEKYWISQFKSWGFKLTNSTIGGDGSEGYSHTEESKQKMRLSKLGTKASDETRKLISQKIKELSKSSPNYNKVKDRKIILSKDKLYNLYIIENLSIPKISKLLNISEKVIFINLKEYNIKKDKSIWKKQCSNGSEKSVLQYDLKCNFIKEWNSVIEISKELGYNSGNLAACCRGATKTCMGFIWRYKENFTEIDLSSLNERKRIVYQFDKLGNLINKFDSISDASKSSGALVSVIQSCCSGRVNSAGGYIWSYNGILANKYKRADSRSVVQYDLEMNYIGEYDTIANAARSTNSRPNCIQMCCVGKYKNSNGFVWRYKD